MRSVIGTEQDIGTRSEVSDLVVAHVLAGVAGGQSVSKITRRGLVLRHLRETVDGEIEAVFCLISRKTLERRYRKVLARQIAAFERVSEPYRREGARTIGIGAPRLPLSLSHGKILKRGRPKKLRAAKTPS